MSREVRMVPADWKHPKKLDIYGREVYEALLDGEEYQSRVDDWDEEYAEWKSGWRPDYCDEEKYQVMTYEQWAGQRPHKDEYMPDWPVSERTHYMMYETTSEGTPISPAFETPEKLARWLADNDASSFANCTATYEQWLSVAKGGWAPNAVYTSEKGLISGVAAMADTETKEA